MQDFSYNSRFFFSVWRRINTLPGPLVQKWQFRELKRAFTEAYEHIPMYRALWNSVDLRPEHVRAWGDIARVPITSKSVFRGFPIEQTYHAHMVKEGPIIWNQTSGSTGIPFKYAMSSFYVQFKVRHHLRFSEFSKYRYLAWKGESLNTLISMTVAELGVPYPRPNFKYFSVNEINCDPEKVLNGLKEFQPFLIEALPTSLLEIVRRSSAQAKRDLRVPYISIHGEHLTEADRRIFSETFASDVFARYGIGETGVIGEECQEHNGYHIYNESYLVEILDENGMRVPQGEAGRVVISFFYNDVMPFLRYDTGDWGRILPSACRCGLASDRLVVHGRRAFVYPHGEKQIGIVQFEMVLSEFSDHILSSQIARTRDGALEIRIVPSAAYTKKIQRNIVEMCKEMTTVTPVVRLVNFLPASTRGKTVAFVDEFGQNCA